MGVLTFRPCEECNYRGWVHSHDPFEIQACDTCTPEDFCDTDAIRHHREDCGCDWPEYDFPSAIVRHLDYNTTHVGDVELSGMLEDIRDLAGDYGDFQDNLEVLMVKLGNALTYAEELKTGTVPDDVMNSMGCAAEYLVQVFALKRTGRLPKHWFENYELGTYNEKKDQWKRPKERT